MTDYKSRVTDVIIIGSGPAGCAAAATCRQAGLQVLIVTGHDEQNDFAGSSIGPLESIHPGVSSLLNKIGAGGSEISATRALYSGIYASGKYTPLGEDENGKWEGMHIQRDIFNAQLIRNIKESGVPVLFNQEVEDFILENGKVVGIQSRSQKFFANYIIDASGKNSIAGKKLKWKRKFFSPPLLCWTGISKTDDSFLLDQQAAHFIAGENGWSWLAPQPPGYCAWTRLSRKGEKQMLPPDELKNGEVVGKIHYANMRWRMYRPVCSEGVVLCGDAAGILDPAAGQGIFNALYSGIMAANTIIACLQQPELVSFHLAQYDGWFVQQFEGKVKQLREYYQENGISI
jgi:flavin-dependent dehydrogenase